MFFGLARGASTPRHRSGAVLSDIETLNRAAFGGATNHRGILSRLRAPGGQVRAAAARRQHGRPLRRSSSAARVARPRSKARGSRSLERSPPRISRCGCTSRTSSTSWCRSIRFSRRCSTARRKDGMLIHEGQLTYAEEGRTKIVDLGEWWGGLPAACRCRRRQHHQAGSRRRDDCQGLEDAARQHRRCADPPRRSRRIRDSVRPRLDREAPIVRRDVCEHLTLSYGERGRLAGRAPARRRLPAGRSRSRCP